MALPKLRPWLDSRITARTVDEVECATSVALAILVAHLLGTSHVAWAAYSGYMVMRGHAADTLRRGALRILGTLAGCATIMQLTALPLSPALLAGLTLLPLGAASLYFSLTARYSYAWLFFGLTYAMIALDRVEQPDTVVGNFVATRLLETLAGTGACIAVSLLSTLTLRRFRPGTRTPPPPDLGWHRAAFALALQGGIALTLLVALDSWLKQAFGLEIPALAQGAISIMAVLLVPLKDVIGPAPVREKLVLRFFGCIAGAGFSLLFLFAAHFIGYGAPWILLTGTLIGIMLGRHFENSSHRWRYAGVQFSLAVLVILVADSSASAELAPGMERLAGILVGTALLEPVLIGWHLLRRAILRRAILPHARHHGSAGSNAREDAGI